MLVCERIRQTNYDSINDILCVKFENDRGMSYGDDGPMGFEIMRDMESDEVTGLMVYYPKRRLAERQSALNQMGYNIDLSKAIAQ